MDVGDVLMYPKMDLACLAVPHEVEGRVVDGALAPREVELHVV